MNEQVTNTISTYGDYCTFRLPCGICIRTNSYCPIAGNTISSPYTYSPGPTCTINSGTTNSGGKITST